VIEGQARAGFYAADRIIFVHRPDIHTRHVWNVTDDGIVEGSLVDDEPSAAADTLALPPARRAPQVRLIALKSDLSPVRGDDPPSLIASAIEVAEHIEGPVAGRIVRILYR
jgi:hypothetical protein